jgi:hypothetical protein
MGRTFRPLPGNSRPPNPRPGALCGLHVAHEPRAPHRQRPGPRRSQGATAASSEAEVPAALRVAQSLRRDGRRARNPEHHSPCRQGAAPRRWTAELNNRHFCSDAPLEKLRWYPDARARAEPSCGERNFVSQIDGPGAVLSRARVAGRVPLVCRSRARSTRPPCHASAFKACRNALFALPERAGSTRDARSSTARFLHRALRRVHDARRQKKEKAHISRLTGAIDTDHSTEYLGWGPSA